MSNLVLGRLGLVVGLAAALLGASAGMVGIRQKRTELLGSLRVFGYVALGGVIVATVAMQRALITRDFELDYVAKVGSSKTPPLFNVAAMWSSLEGSILLWVLILGLFVALVSHKYKSSATDEVVAWAQVCLFVILAFFMFLAIGPANPFRPSDLPPGFVDGPGPNPLLQNHILVAFHPPMLYVGYVGFVVPFAFAIGALATGRIGEGWLVRTRRWTLVGWAALTGGIVLGAWWSYEVLGWGGYWAWDPVENASLLPWLTGTAFLHSVTVQERRKMLKVWNLALLCATFGLTILGTFLTRSGVLDSVHAFSESSLGPVLLGGFAAVVLVSIVLIAWRGDALRSDRKIVSAGSREAAFWANNILLTALGFVVLLGTTFPLILEAASGDETSVGEPYFNRFAAPIGVALLLLMAVAPAMTWSRTRTSRVSKRAYLPAWFGIGVVFLGLLGGIRGLYPLLGMFLAGFAGATALAEMAELVKNRGVSGLLGRKGGGMVVHVGLVVLALGLIASQTGVKRGEFQLTDGESARVAGNVVTYEGAAIRESRQGVVDEFSFTINGQGPFHPKLTSYEATGQVIGTPSVKVSPLGDVYLAVNSASDDATGSVTVRVIVSPLVGWIWAGGIIMLLGSVLAVAGRSDGRSTRTGPKAEVSAEAELADGEKTSAEKQVSDKQISVRRNVG